MSVSVREAARRLGVSEQRTREMLREGELTGSRIDGHTWLIDEVSVQDRVLVDASAGRPWAETTVAAIVTALSDGGRIDSKSAARLRNTSTDVLWRKIAQVVTVRRFSTRRLEIAREHLALTGESAIDEISEKLVGESRVLHGYLRGIELEDLLDDAGLVENSDGNLAIYQLRSGDDRWVATRAEVYVDGKTRGTRARRALIAVDCARTANTRVRSAGLRALDEMRDRWLAQST